MKPMELKQGMAAQINPNTVRNKAFAACFMVATKPRKFGEHIYVQGLGADGDPAGQAYYRAKWAEMEFVGKAVWAVA